MRKLLGLVLLLAVFTLGACEVDETPQPTEKDIVYADAMSVEAAAKLKCADIACGTEQEFTWTELEPLIENLDEDDYDLTANGGVIAVRQTSGDWEVHLERSGTGGWDWPQGETPSLGNALDCVEDTN